MKAMFQLDENLQICLTRNKQNKTKPPTYCFIQQDFSIRKDKCSEFWMKGIYHNGRETMVLNGIQRVREFLKKENYMLVTYMGTYNNSFNFITISDFPSFVFQWTYFLCILTIISSSKPFFESFAVCLQVFMNLSLLFFPPLFQQDFNFVIWLPFLIVPNTDCLWNEF